MRLWLKRHETAKLSWSEQATNSWLWDVRDVIEKVGIGFRHDGAQRSETNSTKGMLRDSTQELQSFKRLLAVPEPHWHFKQWVGCTGPGDCSAFHWPYFTVFHWQKKQTNPLLIFSDFKQCTYCTWHGLLQNYLTC